MESTTAPVATAWQYNNLQVRRPVYSSSVGYWKNYESHLGPLIERRFRVPCRTRRAGTP